jgi:hypothetical protein
VPPPEAAREEEENDAGRDDQFSEKTLHVSAIQSMPKRSAQRNPRLATLR